jgi:hypothetical protein
MIMGSHLLRLPRMFSAIHDSLTKGLRSCSSRLDHRIIYGRRDRVCAGITRYTASCRCLRPGVHGRPIGCLYAAQSTHTAERGKRYSSNLIHPILEKADQMRVEVYTDTVTRSNVTFYEHIGFKCMEERSVAGTGITICHC